MELLLPKNINMNTKVDGLLWKISGGDDCQPIYLSFQSIEFISPESIILLITLSKHINNITKSKVIWIGMKESVYAYLERIGVNIIPFIEIEPYTKRRQIFFFKSNTPSLNLIEMKIMKKPTQCNEIITETKRILHNWFQDRIASQYTKQITEYIMHISGNSLEHSEINGSGICYYTLQKYQTSQGMQIKVAFGDTGIGIRNSLLNTNAWLPNNDGLAIKRAFIDGLSCRFDKSGGLGFRTVRNTMKRYGGQIAIRSGRAVLHYEAKQDSFNIIRFNVSLPGTQTVFTLS